MASMTINQTGSALTGRVTDEYGEWLIDGRIADKEVTVVWTVPEDGKLRDHHEGHARGQCDHRHRGWAILAGPLTARRTGDANLH
jgi:hypothetical protein